VRRSLSAVGVVGLDGEESFAALVRQARRHPVRVVDMLRAWRHEGRGEGAGAPQASVAGDGEPADDVWAECLRALEYAFAPDELARLTAACTAERHVIEVAAAEPGLRERLERAAREGGFSVAWA